MPEVWTAFGISPGRQAKSNSTRGARQDNRRDSLSCLGAAPLILPKIRQVRRPHPDFIFLAFMGFSFPIQAGGFHTQAAPSMSAVHTHPRGFPHMQAPFPHTFPRLPQSPYACADPNRFSRFSICFRGSTIQSPSSKKPDTDFAETSVSGPANPQPAGSTNPQDLRIPSPQISNQPAPANPQIHGHTCTAMAYASQPDETSVSGSADIAPVQFTRTPRDDVQPAGGVNA